MRRRIHTSSGSIGTASSSKTYPSDFNCVCATATSNSKCVKRDLLSVKRDLLTACARQQRVIVSDSYEEEDTFMSYEEEDTFMSYEEEDTFMSYEEEDTCARQQRVIVSDSTY